ncbi:UNVERIFIED_CONTAM: hypothetical protein FKN15_047927 [Acipenser sinensis]
MEDVLSLHASEEEEGSLSYQEETFHSNSSLDKLERESDTTSEPRFEALVERAARCLRVEWTPAKMPAHKRTLPSFPDFIKEVQLSSIIKALVQAPGIGLAKDLNYPNKQCRTTETHLKKAYAPCTQTARLSNISSLASIYQTSLIGELRDTVSESKRLELNQVSEAVTRIAQLTTWAEGRCLAALVVTRRQLWLSQARVPEQDKSSLLDAPITPGHTFGPAVEEMLQQNLKTGVASKQYAQLSPRKPAPPTKDHPLWGRQPLPRSARTAATHPTALAPQCVSSPGTEGAIGNLRWWQSTATQGSCNCTPEKPKAQHP